MGGSITSHSRHNAIGGSHYLFVESEMPTLAHTNPATTGGIMDYKQLGESELQVSEICLGTMTFGDQNTQADAHAQIERALERGVNFIDTAEVYPVPPKAETQGRTEAYLGDWLSRNPSKRSEIILATKVAGRSQGLSWLRGGTELPKVDRRNIQQAVEDSLRRLRTDYIDLYQIHWPDRYVPKFGQTRFDPSNAYEAIPIPEQLEVLGELVRDGKVRAIGLSNETPWGVNRFVQAAKEFGLPQVLSVQNAYSLLNRTFEQGLDEVCYYHNVRLLPYSPLAFGLLSGKYLHGARPGGARLTRYPEFGGRYTRPNVEPAVTEYVRLASESGLEPAQMALAFIRQQPLTTSTIIGATTLEQLNNNLDSAELKLGNELLEAIDHIHERYPNPAP